MFLKRDILNIMVMVIMSIIMVLQHFAIAGAFLVVVAAFCNKGELRLLSVRGVALFFNNRLSMQFYKNILKQK